MKNYKLAHHCFVMAVTNGTLFILYYLMVIGNGMFVPVIILFNMVGLIYALHLHWRPENWSK